MAIAFDSINTDTDANSECAACDGSTRTINHTVAGSNTVIYWIIYLRDATVGDKAVSSCLFDGSATGVTNIAGASNNGGGNLRGIHMYRLTGPSVGAHTILCTMAGTLDHYAIRSISFTGVDQTTPEDGVAGTTASAATGTSINIARTSTSDNDWWLSGLDIIVGSAGTAIVSTPDPPTAVLAKAYTTVNTNNITYALAYAGPITPAQAATAGWSWTTSREHIANMVVIKPAAAAASNNRRVIMVS